MLGAREIYRLAGDVESACRAGDADTVGRHRVHLAALLRRLQERVRPAFDVAAAQVAETTVDSDAALEPHVLTELVDLLRRQSLSAGPKFSALSPMLRRQMGDSAFETVRAYVDTLDFTRAATALEARRD